MDSLDEQRQKKNDTEYVRYFQKKAAWILQFSNVAFEIMICLNIVAVFHF